jgi:hypothetical protein
MNKFIVTTTINPPTEALEKYIKFQETKGWKLIVVGDLKTPHDTHNSGLYQYMTPANQAEKYGELSEVIGWNSISRRSIGIVEAYHQGADVIATVDDDNIPYDDWSDDLYVGQTVEIDLHKCDLHVFDPLSVTHNSHLWHRGYPIEYLNQRHDGSWVGEQKRYVKVQADLWNGDPDIDAICRIAFSPEVWFDIDKPYGVRDAFSPFNSQNTFLSREVIPDYMLFPHTGRMDDIWASYVLESRHPNSVIYNRASVFQKRNPHDLTVDLENEMLGYKYSKKLLDRLYSGNDYRDLLPEPTRKFEAAYRKALGV